MQSFEITKRVIQTYLTKISSNEAVVQLRALFSDPNPSLSSIAKIWKENKRDPFVNDFLQTHLPALFSEKKLFYSFWKKDLTTSLNSEIETLARRLSASVREEPLSLTFQVQNHETAPFDPYSQSFFSGVDGLPGTSYSVFIRSLSISLDLRQKLIQVGLRVERTDRYPQNIRTLKESVSFEGQHALEEFQNLKRIMPSLLLELRSIF